VEARNSINTSANDDHGFVIPITLLRQIMRIFAEGHIISVLRKIPALSSFGGISMVTFSLNMSC